jgi:hypothetical protein
VSGTAPVVVGPILLAASGGTCLRRAWLDLGGVTLALQDETAGYFCSSLDLGFPAVREVVTNRPDQDGLTDRTAYMGARVVTAAITALVGAGARIDEVAAAFAPYMAPANRPVLHYVLDRPDTPERTLTLRGAGYSWPVAGAYQRDIQLQWVAADPIARAPAVQTATAAVAGPATITTPGDVAVRPHFRVTGPITAAVVTLTPPLFPPWTMAFLASFTIAAGHFVDIDTDARTVYLDGDAAQPRLASLDWTQSSWQWVPPNTATTMTLAGTATTAATAVTATWQDGFLS